MEAKSNRLYYCDEGKVFIRLSDNFIMGNGIDLGDNDSIENYGEIDDPELKENDEI